jgi:predicted kinase
MIMSKNVLIVLGGLPASGKSTYAEMLREINPTFQRVCPDLIRKAFYGDESIQGDGKRVFNTAFHDLKEYGSVGANVIFDATNINADRRKKFVKEMRGYFDIIIFKWFDTPLDICKDRNAKRDRVVPEEVLKRMWFNFEEPTMEEGWDYIEKIKNY